MSEASIDNTADGSEGVGSSAHGIHEAVQGVAFWGAVVLPFLQVSLLLTGLQTQSYQIAFGMLFVANVFALLVGHQYRQE